MTNQIYVDQNTGELRGSKPRQLPIGLILLAGAAFAGLSCVGINLTSSSSTQVEATGGRDAIPVRSINGAMYVYANLGGIPHNMILDTGASMTCITVPIANALLARRKAHIVPGIFHSTIADGSVSSANPTYCRSHNVHRAACSAQRANGSRRRWSTCAPWPIGAERNRQLHRRSGSRPESNSTPICYQSSNKESKMSDKEILTKLGSTSRPT